MIGQYTAADLAHFLRRRELLRQADRGEITADQACAALGIRPISGGALPVTITKTQVASTDSPANAPTVFNTNTYQALEDLFGIPDALAVGRALLRSVLAGCQLSNDGTTPNSVIDVAAGIAMSSDQLLLMDIGAFTGSTAGIWATGTGANKMDTSTAVAANTWYHVYVIGGGGTATDILFSTNATAPTLPSTYTKQRRLGSFKTAAASTNILAFTQTGDYFLWTASVLDIDGPANPGTNAVTRTLASVPTGVSVFPIFTANMDASTSTTVVVLSDLSANDEVPSESAAPLGLLRSAANGLDSAFIGGGIRTNTSGQIRSRFSSSTAAATLRIATLGWIDRRGRDS